MAETQKGAPGGQRSPQKVQERSPLALTSRGQPNGKA
jgi:hypothetical protein